MKYITLQEQIVDKALEALDFYAEVESKEYKAAYKALKEENKKFRGWPKLPFLAKKSRRGIRAYLEPDIQWYHQKRNALEVLEAFQLLQEEASSPFSLFIVWMFSFHMPSLKTNPND